MPAFAFMCIYEEEADRPTVQKIADKAELVLTGVLKEKIGFRVQQPRDVILIFEIIKVQKGSYQESAIDVGGLVTGIGGSQSYEEGGTYTIAVRPKLNGDQTKAKYINIASLCEVPVIVKAHLTQEEYLLNRVE
jgi:hypothetical protein